ncbi:hypothetical protein [Aurantiacibacter flavus]|uniref:Uncharacterized protein n=1 Tax=Aurantiacibacter flavus TaxID=3145232 RepID=A0ABV0CWX9_9SPHN
MGKIAEQPFQRLCVAVGGGLLSTFGPSVVPDPFEPVLVWLGLSLVSGAIVWPFVNPFLQNHFFWRFNLRNPAQNTKGEPPGWALLVAADHVLARIHARTSWNSASRARKRVLLKGEAALITFSKNGFMVPELPEDEQKALERLDEFFSSLEPLLRAGHVKEAKERAKELTSNQTL